MNIRKLLKWSLLLLAFLAWKNIEGDIPWMTETGMNGYGPYYHEPRLRHWPQYAIQGPCNRVSNCRQGFSGTGYASMPK